MEQLEEQETRGVSVDTYFIDSRKQAWAISPSQLYANTPADFEYKLPSCATKFESVAAMVDHIKGTADVVFPTVHGAFGEDGELQEALESAGVPFVGSEAAACRVAFNKRSSRQALLDKGFPVLAQASVTAADFDVAANLTVRFPPSLLCAACICLAADVSNCYAVPLF